MFDRSRDKKKQKEQRPSSPEIAAPAPTPTTTPQPATSRSAAMIGQSIEIKGEITGNEDLVIKGSVEGTIDLAEHEVTIGDSGKVRADIKGKTVTINGEVTGDISGTEKVVISKTGRVRGNIISPRMMLEDGAVFKGSIDMDPGDAAKNSRTSSSEAKPAVAPASTSSTYSTKLDVKSG